MNTEHLSACATYETEIRFKGTCCVATLQIRLEPGDGGGRTSDCDVEYPPDVHAECIEGRCEVTAPISQPF